MKVPLRTAAHALAAIPACFLTFSYLITVGWLIVYGVPAWYGQEPMPDQSDWFFRVSEYGLYALAVQWPLYIGWAALTRRLTRRLKALWIAVLIVFSVFAIPFFLFSMWRRTELTDLIRFIRRRDVRRYFAAGIVAELPPPVGFHADLPAAYREVRFRCEEGAVPPEFRIITAWNPEGEILSPAVNAVADEHLRSEIDRLRFESFPVTGGNADFSHAEPGYGIVCNRAEAVLLARRFRQLGFYEVLGGRVYLVSVHEGHAPGDPIGRWRDLLDSEEAIPEDEGVAEEALPRQ